MDRPSRRRGLVTAVVVATLLVAAFPAAGTARPEGEPAPAPVQRVLAGSGPLRAGELLVQRTARVEGLDRALSKVNGRAVRALGNRTALVQVPPGRELHAAALLRFDPTVAHAEPNYVRTAAAYSDAEVGWGVRRIRATRVWDAPTGGATGVGVRVAVLDSGVDPSQDQLREQLHDRLAKGRDLYGTGGVDECGHGTAVAGVIAAAGDGESIVGVAPGATIVPVKVLNADGFGSCGGSDAELIEGLRWAADPERGNADIINLSLSGPQRSVLLRQAVQYATKQGVLVVAAAGNTGDREVQYPAAYKEVVSVGGIQRDGTSIRWWPYTSFARVDIAAAAKTVPIITARNSDPRRIARQCPGRPGWCADGTSFAAPHVAGAAALLAQQHNLDSLDPAARVRRLRQWLLGTAPRVPGRSGGLDLKTGHGAADVAAASAASVDSDRLLASWQTTQRIIAPSRRMVALPSAISAGLTLTTGTGRPLAGRAVTLSGSSGAVLTTTTATTGTTGRVSTVLRSTAADSTARLVARVGGRSLSADALVLQRDENTPGVPIPASPFRNRLDSITDIDDVFRVYLRAGETIRARMTEMGGSNEYGDLLLLRGETRDVADAYLGPLREPEPYDNYAKILRRTVHTDGRRYLDIYGRGSYRIVWSIYSPRMVRRFDATPATITPDGDGRRDTTRVTWSLARRGRVVVRVVNPSGNVVRRVDLGREPRGGEAFRWDGRSGSGRLVREGTYRVRVSWSRGPRVSAAATKVTVER